MKQVICQVQEIKEITNSTFIIAIIMIGLCDLFFIGGAYFLCAYKDWSLWTIVIALFIAGSTTSSIYKIIGIRDEDDDKE